ncbi:hypothetical protein [Litoribacillus peritrichatus]|uniref:Uncharacterized protein n=1 Tax=Litoribacillus peritrichatus TaxID=718191 RepID=A0ABP7ML12_9GAMM
MSKYTRPFMASFLTCAVASVSLPVLAKDRYDTNFSELDRSVACSVEKQAQLIESNSALTASNQGLEKKLAKLQGRVAELQKRIAASDNQNKGTSALVEEKQQLQGQLTKLQDQTREYISVCRDYKTRLDQITEQNKILKDSLALKQQSSNSNPAPSVAVDCPTTTPVVTSSPVNCPDVGPVTHTSNASIPAIQAHPFLSLDGVLKLNNDKRADAVLSIRKFLPMPLDKPTYFKLVHEGISDDKWNWDERAEVVKHLIRHRPRDLTEEDLKTLLVSSVNDRRNDILKALLSGAQYPISFDGGLALISGFYDQTDWAQDRKVEAISMLSFYLPRNLSEDQVFQLTTGLTGKQRTRALQNLTSKIRTDFSHEQKKRLLDGFYSQSDHGKKQWNLGYDALSPEKRSFVF